MVKVLEMMGLKHHMEKMETWWQKSNISEGVGDGGFYKYESSVGYIWLCQIYP